MWLAARGRGRTRLGRGGKDLMRIGGAEGRALEDGLANLDLKGVWQGLI